MDLLFKEAGFEADFRNLVGFVDADFKFSKLRADLRTATKEMITLIGAPQYAAVLALHEAELGPGEQPNELVELVRYPIALNAYRLYAPTNDLKHGNNGRATRHSDKEKAPFEWMIKRDNDNQERKYYRALDDLLNYLDAEGAAEWKESAASKKLKSQFVNKTSDFEEYFPIQSRLLLLKLIPGLRKAEREYILPALGKSKYDTLKTLVKTSEPIPEEDQPLVDLIQEACIYFSLSWAMKVLTINLFPEGVLQQYVSERLSVSAKKTPEGLQTQLADQEFYRAALKAVGEIELLLKDEAEASVADADPATFNFDYNFGDDDKFIDT